MNAWERQSSALDPVGITSKKMAAKHRADQASYKPGESVTFKKEKLMVFEQNPENNFSTSGTVKGGVKTAKVLVCGDLFAKVEFEDGSQGYVSLSEVVNPQEMHNLTPVVTEGLEQAVSGLGMTLFGEIAKAADDAWKRTFAGRTSITRKALSPLKTMQNQAQRHELCRTSRDAHSWMSYAPRLKTCRQKAKSQDAICLCCKG